MRRMGIAAAAFLMVSAASAEEPTAPVAKAFAIEFDRTGPDVWVAPWEGPSRDVLFSARLAALFARDQRYGHESHGVGLLAFDPLLPDGFGGKDQRKLSVVSRDGGKAVVEATQEGSSGSAARKILFKTVDERGAWRIDEIEERGKKGELVSLNQVLQGPHACGAEVGKPCAWPPETAPSAANGAPADVVMTIYKFAFKDVKNPESTYSAYGDATLSARFFSAALLGTVDGIDAIDRKYNSAVIDFDPITSSNGIPDPSNLVVRAVKSDARSALVVAAFGKGRERRSVAYHFVKAGEAWRIDDISSAPGATGVNVWSLRHIYDDALAAIPKE